MTPEAQVPTSAETETPPVEGPIPKQETIFLICREPANAFTCEEARNLAWRWDMGMNLDSTVELRHPAKEESWTSRKAEIRGQADISDAV